MHRNCTTADQNTTTTTRISPTVPIWIIKLMLHTTDGSQQYLISCANQCLHSFLQIHGATKRVVLVSLFRCYGELAEETRQEGNIVCPGSDPLLVVGPLEVTLAVIPLQTGKSGNAQMDLIQHIPHVTRVLPALQESTSRAVADWVEPGASRGGELYSPFVLEMSFKLL